MSALTREVLIVNKRGLHARASAKFVAMTAEMSGTTITVSKGASCADGSSILDLMMLGAAKGDTVILTTSGEDAQTRLAELVALVEAGFDED